MFIILNLHAPTSECITMNKSLLGALGIPELMSPNWRRIFIVKYICKKFSKTKLTILYLYT